jgi:predicted transglutaminase-like cysteine proteinase
MPLLGSDAMHQSAKTLAVTVAIAAACWASVSQAAVSAVHRYLRMPLEQVSFGQPTLAPIQHSIFCLRYRDDCEVRKLDFRHRNFAMTRERLNELEEVNRQVNRAIVPQSSPSRPAADEWLVSPRAGDCNDYAVTKRHQLLARGWPMRSLLLAEVIVPWGEHHLVLVVRMKDPDQNEDIDMVLDNLNPDLRPVGLTPYHWVRAESPVNPKYWSIVSVP